MKQNRNPSYKVVIVGESGVGKTTLMHSYIKELTEHDVKPTVGIEFGSKNIHLSDGKPVTLHLWDTAGSEKYRSVVKNFYRGSSAVILVYSMANLSSFEKLQYWYKEARENSNNNATIFIIGTHADLEESRQVTRQQLYEWTSKNHVDAVEEISARDLGSIRRLFNNLAEKIHLDKLLRKVQLEKTSRLQAFESTSLDPRDLVVKKANKCCNV